jgi:hypothetical protein
MLGQPTALGALLQAQTGPLLAGLFAGKSNSPAAGRLKSPWLGRIPPGHELETAADLVVARRPKPRDQASRPEEAKPLRIVFARKPGKKYWVYRQPAAQD